jgi:coenzyme PQQ biosynthesis enzyme PqqE
MPKFEDRLETFSARDRKQWREWLEKNHHTVLGVWLVYYKVKSGKPSIQYSEAVKEALCFGWIDSKVKSLDEERYMQIFTPRKPKSVWSKLNKQYIEELIKNDLMTEAGLAKIEAAKQDESWNQLDAIEALIIPTDLKQALELNENAKKYFEAFNNSSKKNILFWIESAKRPETRLKRIEQTADRVELANTQYYGWALQNQAALLPTKEQLQQAEQIIAARRNGRMKILYVLSDYYQDYPKPCMGGWGMRSLVVAPDGSVLPCQVASSIPNLTFANVRDCALDWIWFKDATFNRFRGTDWMSEPCRSCDRREIDFGGCRCQAFLLTGDATATDPVCHLSPYHHLISNARAETTQKLAFVYRRDSVDTNK